MQKTKSGPSSATTQNAGIMKNDPSIQMQNVHHADGILGEEKSHSVLKFYYPHITINAAGKYFDIFYKCIHPVCKR